MQNTVHLIRSDLQAAFKHAFDHVIEDDLIEIQRTSQIKFGHFQSNIAMKMAKALKQSPQSIGQRLIEPLTQHPYYKQITIAGPGFINFFMSEAYFNDSLHQMGSSPTLGIQSSHPPLNIIVDYSSPNVAKKMHVGHLRSTIIGDSIVRLLTFCGHRVIRQNHIGDWGTQFGMLIEYLIQNASDPQSADVTTAYQAAKKQFDDDPAFAERAKARVVLLQQGDAATIAIWQSLVENSERHFSEVYERLGVLLNAADIRPESYFNDQLQPLVDTLTQSEICVVDQGAKVIFLDGFKDQEDRALPMIIQKSDGGFLYATTDLAALQFRLERLKADRIIYCVDSRQQQHFDMLFAAAKKIGWIDQQQLEYALFGTVLGEDHRPFKTRSGDTVALLPLIDQAIEKAKSLIIKKHPNWAKAQLNQTAQSLAISAIKYADLSNDKIKNYLFSEEKMLAFDGNTAPYLLNAYVRIQSLFRKANCDVPTAMNGQLDLSTEVEIQLAHHLCYFPIEIEAIAKHLELHRLCHYLYQLAMLFHRFYEHHPILNDRSQESRLALAALVSRVLAQGFSILGIQTIDYM
ncbi:MAG: arginine--tRNA ligase [Legionellales bacterium]|nr:arginine--tRNA ligase [Legionellales bacterium]OUX66945.1 MAG: arginine--tRNA ligase [bacterium TMED178]